MATEQSMTSDVFSDDMIQTEDNLLNDNETDVSGISAEEFALMVAETASAFLPEGSDVESFKLRYVTFVTPMLKMGGFEKLAQSGMSISSIVERSPWVGAIICSAATIAGLYITWPKGGEHAGYIEMGAFSRDCRYRLYV